MNNLLDTKELAAYYKVSRQAVHKWREFEGFPYQQMGAKTFRYDLQEVEQYFKNKAKK